MNVKITKVILDDLTAQAKASPRLRMNLDLRNSSSDGSQRMLNAIEPGSPMPIHRHMKSSETVVCLRGNLQEVFYSDAGEVMEIIDLAPGSDCVALNIPIGQWHTVRALESGTVLLECKDGAYEPLGEEDVLSL
jgi:cupin fold WbuC family metalloprotein